MAVNWEKVREWRAWKMNNKRAIEVIEKLRDYAYENWDGDEYGEQLEEIGAAVDYIKLQFSQGGKRRFCRD